MKSALLDRYFMALMFEYDIAANGACMAFVCKFSAIQLTHQKVSNHVFVTHPLLIIIIFEDMDK